MPERALRVEQMLKTGALPTKPPAIFYEVAGTCAVCGRVSIVRRLPLTPPVELDDGCFELWQKARVASSGRRS